MYLKRKSVKVKRKSVNATFVYFKTISYIVNVTLVASKTRIATVSPVTSNLVFKLLSTYIRKMNINYYLRECILTLRE